MKDFNIGERFYIPYKDVDDIPLDEFKNLYKAYWTYIADTGVRYKPSIFSSITCERLHVILKCFACKYNDRLLGGFCQKCPFKIYRTTYQFDRITSCVAKNSLLYKWKFEDNKEKRRELSLEIANLEWEDLH